MLLLKAILLVVHKIILLTVLLQFSNYLVDNVIITRKDKSTQILSISVV